MQRAITSIPTSPTLLYGSLARRSTKEADEDDLPEFTRHVQENNRLKLMPKIAFPGVAIPSTTSSTSSKRTVLTIRFLATCRWATGIASLNMYGEDGHAQRAQARPAVRRAG